MQISCVTLKNYTKKKGIPIGVFRKINHNPLLGISTEIPGERWDGIGVCQILKET